MATKLVWSPKAKADVRRIYVDIGKQKPLAAERYFERIRFRAKMLVEQPRIGPRRREISPTARVLVEAPYIIIYATDPDTDEGPVERVEVVRVVDGRRDLSTLF